MKICSTHEYSCKCICKLKREDTFLTTNKVQWCQVLASAQSNCWREGALAPRRGQVGSTKIENRCTFHLAIYFSCLLPQRRASQVRVHKKSYTGIYLLSSSKIHTTKEEKTQMAIDRGMVKLYLHAFYSACMYQMLCSSSKVQNPMPTNITSSPRHIFKWQNCYYYVVEFF